MSICTAKASGISRERVKSRCAREWGGWGRISEDGPGQQTRTGARAPGTVEREAACTEVLTSASPRTESREYRWQQTARRTVANQHAGKAPSEIRALKPYRGKPAVRNFRGSRTARPALREWVGCGYRRRRADHGAPHLPRSRRPRRENAGCLNLHPLAAGVAVCSDETEPLYKFIDPPWTPGWDTPPPDTSLLQVCRPPGEGCVDSSGAKFGPLRPAFAQPFVEGVAIQNNALPRVLHIALLSELVHVRRYVLPCRADMLGEQFLSKVDHPH